MSLLAQRIQRGAATLIGATALILCGTAAHACSDSPYIGSICTVAFNWCPDGTLEANGQEVTVNQYQALYSLIAATYGSTQPNVKFNLPDLRGRSVVGVGQGTGLQPITLAQKRGNESVNLTVPQLPAHTHAATFNQTGSNPITVNIPVSTGVGSKLVPDATNNYMAGTTSGQTGANMWTNQAGQTAPVNIGGVTTAGGSSGTVTNANTGGGQAVPTLPPQLGMKQCIVVNGIYPPRPN